MVIKMPAALSLLTSIFSSFQLVLQFVTSHTYTATWGILVLSRCTSHGDSEFQAPALHLTPLSWFYLSQTPSPTWTPNGELPHLILNQVWSSYGLVHNCSYQHYFYFILFYFIFTLNLIIHLPTSKWNTLNVFLLLPHTHHVLTVFLFLLTQ
jgi:hypothetical protein